MAGKRLKVLIVDDSELCRELTRAVLEERGYEVVTLDGPFGFSRVLNQEKPDVALVDIRMPALEGDKLVEIVSRHELHRCPIVLFSDRSEDELARLARLCGAAGFVHKSGDGEMLVHAIERSLRGPGAGAGAGSRPMTRGATNADVRDRFLPRFLDIARQRQRRAGVLLARRRGGPAAAELHALAGEAAMLDLGEIADAARAAKAAARRGDLEGCLRDLHSLAQQVEELDVP
ncbi:MAG: response regulator [Deltaproteobacteria bacterium]|nr:response regulator [Deltaproteobacteria bacterium]